MRSLGTAFFSAALACAALSGCGGSSATPAATPVTAPSPSTAPSGAPTTALQPSASAIAFTANTAMPLTVTETGYTGVFHESDTCAPLSGAIASVTTMANPPAGSASYSVAPLAAGTCQITLRDDGANSVVVPVTVSTAAITVQ
jgi:hypothetical protein